tara:strand:+ start:466 stop:1266 length:801 start_codon:yes stop_codon:yes gene_type:complete
MKDNLITEKPKLLIKAPTRARPDKFKEVLQKYVDYLSNKYPVRFVITCDTDDETMNNQEMRGWMDQLADKLKEKNHSLVYHFGDSKNKIEAVNANMENEEFDVLLLFSDDMIPKVVDYDEIIVRSMEYIFPEGGGALNFNDGYRRDWPALMTLTVMHYDLYKKFGYIYSPEYISLWADNEQTLACRMMGKLADVNLCIIRHEWVPGNDPSADELHIRNEDPAMYEHDEKIFKNRMQRDFDIKKEDLKFKLTINDKNQFTMETVGND